MDVGFHFNFGFGWEGHGLVSGCLLFASGVRGSLVLKLILGVRVIFLKKIFSLFCGGTLLIFVQHSLIHSHNFLCIWRKCKFLMVFFFFGGGGTTTAE